MTDQTAPSMLITAYASQVAYIAPITHLVPEIVLTLFVVEVSHDVLPCDWRVTHHGFSYSTFGF